MLHSPLLSARNRRAASIESSVGFPPIAREDARVLILGSLPGAESLRQRRYYAMPHNRFWWIMGEIAGARPDLGYAARLDRLRRCGIAVWDVCASAERAGSLDAAIVQASVVANDFGRFLNAHRRIGLICFNGRGAETMFRRLALPGMSADQVAIRRACLPSTSAAHAGMPPDEKLQRWRRALSDKIGVLA
jgi:hypoxanthine-DNA glycosylase